MQFVRTALISSATLALAWVTPVTISRAAAAVGPVTIVSHIDVIPDAYIANNEERAQAAIRAEIAATKADKGLLSYVVLQQTDGPNHFTIVETWADAASFAAHTGSPHTIKFRQDIQAGLGSPFDARTHHAFQ